MLGAESRGRGGCTLGTLVCSTDSANLAMKKMGLLPLQGLEQRNEFHKWEYQNNPSTFLFGIESDNKFL